MPRENVQPHNSKSRPITQAQYFMSRPRCTEGNQCGTYETSMSDLADISLIGLGESLALNMESKGFWRCVIKHIRFVEASNRQASGCWPAWRGGFSRAVSERRQSEYVKLIS